MDFWPPLVLIGIALLVYFCWKSSRSKETSDPSTESLSDADVEQGVFQVENGYRKRHQGKQTENYGKRSYGFRDTFRQKKKFIDDEGNMILEVVVNEFVPCNTRRDAEEQAREMGEGEEPIRHNPHKPGDYYHYHVGKHDYFEDRNGQLVNYHFTYGDPIYNHPSFIE